MINGDRNCLFIVDEERVDIVWSKNFCQSHARKDILNKNPRENFLGVSSVIFESFSVIYLNLRCTSTLDT